METGGAPPAGIKIMGRWHDVGRLKGYAIFEGDDPITIATWAYQWSDLMTLEVFPVITDEQLGKVLAA